MNPEQKKEYMAPTMNIVQVRYQNRLMGVSEEEKEPFDGTEETTGELS